MDNLVSPRLVLSLIDCTCTLTNALGKQATARYEMLHLTEEDHKLGPPVGCHNTREFLILTQLHELFCWVHQLKPLDLMGKPWSNYHLEMQLFWDAEVVQRSCMLQFQSLCPCGPRSSWGT